MSKKLILGGQQKSVPAYYEGQNAQGVPNHYVGLEDANRLRQCGRATTINRGKAILIRGPRRNLASTRDSQKTDWKVVGQTSKRRPSGPGFPRWSSV